MHFYPEVSNLQHKVSIKNLKLYFINPTQVPCGFVLHFLMMMSYSAILLLMFSVNFFKYGILLPLCFEIRIAQ